MPSTIGPVSITNPGTLTNYDGDVVSYGVSASDTAGNPLSYSAVNLPLGESIDPSTGIISGTIYITDDASSPYSAATVTATDTVTGASASATFTWDVLNPVSVTAPSDQYNYDGDTGVSLTVFATDADSNSLNYTATGLPPGLGIGATTGIISPNIDSTDDTSSPYSVTVTATDTVNGASATTPFNWYVSPVTVSLSNPGDQSNYDADTVSLSLAPYATDSAGHTLAYNITGGALPDGLGLDLSSGIISGTITDTADAGSVYSVTVQAADSAADVSASQTFNWTVANPVTLTNPGDQTNYDGDTGVSLQLSGSALDGNPVTYTLTSGSLPSGLTLDTSTGDITGNIPTTGDDGSYSPTITATDSGNSGLSAAQTFNWTITPPTLLLSNPGGYDNLDGDSVSGVSLLEFDNAVSYPLTGAAVHTVTYTATGLPTGLTIDSGSGIISGTVGNTADTDSPYSVTVTATDTNADVTASQTFSWEIDPLVTPLSPGDQTNCIGDAVDIYASAFDAAGNSVGYTADNLPPGLAIDSGSGEITGTVSDSAVPNTPYSVTVTATDDTTGAAVNDTFNWTIVSINVVNPGDQFNLDADAVSIPISGSTSNPSTDTLTFSASGLPDGLSINSSTGVISGNIADTADTSSPYSVTVTLTDSTAGQSSSQTFNWTVAVPATNDDSSFTTTENQAISGIDITRDSNSPDDPSMVTNIITGPSNGTLAENSDGTYTYTPNTGFTGTDSFTYDVVVGDPVTSNISTDTITVAADLPTIGSSLSYTTLAGQSLALNDLTTNATDPAGASLTAQIVAGPSNGTLTPNGSGYTYTPNTGFTGSDSFTYDVTNGSNTSGTTTVSLTVGSSDPLIANPALEQTPMDQALTISPASLLADAQSATGAALVLCSYTQPADGTLAWSGANLIYTPTAGVTGPDSFTFNVTDGTHIFTEMAFVQVNGPSRLPPGENPFEGAPPAPRTRATGWHWYFRNPVTQVQWQYCSAQDFVGAITPICQAGCAIGQWSEPAESCFNDFIDNAL